MYIENVLYFSQVSEKLSSFESKSRQCTVCVLLLQVHLFDIDIPGGIRFKESEILTAGKTLTVFNTDVCKVGIGICYDMRFDEMARLYRKEGKYQCIFNVGKILVTFYLPCTGITFSTKKDRPKERVRELERESKII